MSREKNLAKNTLIVSIGKICTQLITFLLLPLYTGILSTEEYGTVDLLTTLVSLMLPIVTFQVEQAVFRELVEYRNDEIMKKKIISSGFFSVSIQCLVFFLVFIIVSPFINNVYKFYLVANVIGSIFNSFLLQTSRGFGKNLCYAFSSFLCAATTIFFNVVFLVVLKYRVVGMLLGTLLGHITNIIYLFFRLKIYHYLSTKSFYKSIVRKLWKYSLPLVPNQISWWIFNTSDRVIVSILLGLSFTGLLSAASKFSSMFVAIYSIFNLTWTESISLHIHDSDIKDYFNNMFRVIVNFFSAICIGMIACMPFVYPILINKKFVDGYVLVPILILASFFNIIVSIVGSIYVANKNTKVVANTSIIAAIINLVSHLALLKFVGLYAAAISTFLAYFIMALYRIKDVNKKYFSIYLDKNIIIKFLLVLIFVFVTYYINNLYLNLFSIVLAILYAWSMNKNVIAILLKTILKRKI